MKKRICSVFIILVLLFTMIPTAAAAESGIKLVALTFDDGPCENTGRLLDGLAQRGAQATFFVQGFKVEKNPEIIQRMIAEGHQVGNHTYNHPNLATLPLEEAVEQLERTDAILNEATGGKGAYQYRAPFGSSTEEIRAELESPVFHWSLNTNDWAVKNTRAIQQKIVSDIFDGAIILVHDTVPETIDAALGAVDQLQKQGYEFVTLKELFRRRGLETESGSHQYGSCLPTDTLLDALERPVVTAEKKGNSMTITLESESDAPIYYTVDGSPIVFHGKRYTGKFTVSLPCTVRAVTAVDLNGSRSEEVVITLAAGAVEQKTDIADQTKLTRGMLAQLLYEKSGVKLAQAEALFSDVPVTHPYAEAITWAYGTGVFDGTGHRSFKPDQTASRQEVAKVLVAFLDAEKKASPREYADEAQIAAWASEAVHTVTALGLMQGGTDGNFRPQNIMTGAEAKIVLSRLNELT